MWRGSFWWPFLWGWCWAAGAVSTSATRWRRAIAPALKSGVRTPQLGAHVKSLRLDPKKTGSSARPSPRAAWLR